MKRNKITSVLAIALQALAIAVFIYLGSEGFSWGWDSSAICALLPLATIALLIWHMIKPAAVKDAVIALLGALLQVLAIAVVVYVWEETQESAWAELLMITNVALALSGALLLCVVPNSKWVLVVVGGLVALFGLAALAFEPFNFHEFNFNLQFLLMGAIILLCGLVRVFFLDKKQQPVQAPTAPHIPPTQTPTAPYIPPTQAPTEPSQSAAVFCGRCGQAVVPGNDFCTNCGNKL